MLESLENAPVSTKPNPSTVMEILSVQREISEIQAMVMLAKRFPRNQIEATERILIECQRPGLAEVALYTYAREGTDITGPSIRLAETIARNWGNLESGVKELSQQNGQSEMISYCWDLENNTRQSKTFTVKHERYTKKGSYAVSDPRDVYEISANFAARRLRAVILANIPGDVIDAAVNECESTLKAKADLSPEGLKRMVSAFEVQGVNKEQIEKRIQRRLESITAGQVVGLKKILNSLKDSMSQVSDWFEVAEGAEIKKSGVEGAKEALKQPKGKPVEAQVKSKVPEAGTLDDRLDTSQIDCPDTHKPADLGWCKKSCDKNFTCEAWRV